jgi:hypothetical protein
VGTVVVTGETLGAARAVVEAHQADGMGPVLLVVAQEDIMDRVEDIRRSSTARTVVEERFGLVKSQDGRPPTLALSDLETAFRRMLDKADLAERAVSARLVLPKGIGLDWAGLDEDSPLAQALIIIIDALKAVPVQPIDFRNIQLIARLIARQA